MVAPDQFRFANAFAEVQPDPEGFAYMRCLPGTRRLADYQEAMNALLRVIRATGTGKALVDHKNVAPITAEEQHWVVANWLPRAVVQGNYRYAALVSPPETMAWMNTIDPHLLDWPKAPTFKHFSNEADARVWLRAQTVVASHI
ncbi:STAS/SEC14 domain-containing protein [Hymenobacter oligotrophus]|uniref:STAS/SEC14 domain-containing protein n=1 Tax=Hymenobacter oligotrophus TaxID=2319843 RepID=A0A3B7RTV1_9BACT|nr:STAS/SEC14 domain-containing protein [Hymenobacter oligotrophus]AYA37647.1 STAS/SEC14 domain-containing protein [Hymenobacter oligotrophus]